MKFFRSIWFAILVLIVWLALAWFLGSWMGLKSPAIWALRGGLWFIGVAGFVGYLVLRPKPQMEAGQGGSLDAVAEIDYNFAEAARRIQSATGVKRLGSLPAAFLLGDSGSAKTTTITKSGIEAELLAGLAFQDSAVIPTRTVNFWYARETLFIDPAGSVLADPGARRKLFKKFLPVGLNSVASSKTPPARSVVFTVDCDTLLQPGGAEALGAKARQFQTVLAELSQELGASFPVYVLFTKADRIPYFRDFVETLTEQEVTEVFGITLPLQNQAHGVYAEQQTRRLTDAFQQLYYSLADKRPVCLAREHNAANLPNIYEFPREFAKFRPLLVQFLTDLCRPSQLGTSAFLRGLYFSGVRPVTISDVVPAAQVPVTEEQGFDSGATRMFNPYGRSAPLAAEVAESRSRKIPQWVFLQQLFPGVILADRAGSSVAQSNIKINVARRALLGAIAGAALLMCAWCAISYHNNSTLVRDATEAAQAAPAISLSPGQLASADALRRLTRVKDTLAVLDRYGKDGVPLSLGAFLYAGDSIREPLRVTYYALFRKLLLAPVQQTLVKICSKPEAYESQGYSFIYDSLKSYLITTSHHEKSTPEFLTPALLLHWKNGQPVDPERETLARQNFDFYAAELVEANPYPRFAAPDSGAVETTRAYLLRFKQEESIYHTMLAAAGDKLKAIVFNEDFPGTAETVINKYRAEPYFTKPGFENFQKQLKDPDRYFYGEEWVLGTGSLGNFDRQKLVQDLAERYQQDYIKTWQEYLNKTTVVGYASVPDAAQKLTKLVGPPSSLLLALCVAAENSSVQDKEVSQVFQPVQVVTPPGCLQQPVAKDTSGYMGSLAALANGLKAVGPITNAQTAAVDAANAAVTPALNAASGIGFGFDPKSPVVPKTAQLLKDPIERVPPLLRGAGAGPINATAAGMCRSISSMLYKYPFNPVSRADATLSEVNEFLRPQDGSLWQLYNGSLKPYLTRMGDVYVAASGQSLSVTPAFLNFFNRAARMSEVLYRQNPQQPNMTFTVQAVPTPDVNHMTLTIDGSTLSTDLKSGSNSQTFSWPGPTQSAYLGVRFGGSPEFEINQQAGPWAIWRVLQSAESWQPAGGHYEVQWIFKTSAGVQQIGGTGRAPTVKIAIDAQSAQILRPQYFSSLNCVSKAVQ